MFLNWRFLHIKMLNIWRVYIGYFPSLSIARLPLQFCPSHLQHVPHWPRLLFEKHLENYDTNRNYNFIWIDDLEISKIIFRKAAFHLFKLPLPSIITRHSYQRHYCGLGDGRLSIIYPEFLPLEFFSNVHLDFWALGMR